MRSQLNKVPIVVGLLIAAGFATSSVPAAANPSDLVTIYLPLIQKPAPPLAVGMQLRWDGMGYSRGGDVWDAGYHRTRAMVAMTDADTIQVDGHTWYAPNPVGWAEEFWSAYYSVSVLTLKSSSTVPDPDWKWSFHWILPANLSLGAGQVVNIFGQPFAVAGPLAGYTSFGKPVQYWRLTNQSSFLMWSNGGPWSLYYHPGDVVMHYDAGLTRLQLYMNETRHYYYNGSLTLDTVQWIDQLTQHNMWPSAISADTSYRLPAAGAAFAVDQPVIEWDVIREGSRPLPAH
jgi:hypothetical protein